MITIFKKGLKYYMVYLLRKTILEIFSNAKCKWDYCGDIRSLTLIFSNEVTKKTLLETKRKWTRLSIVETHGGRIWPENNPAGEKGAHV